MVGIGRLFLLVSLTRLDFLHLIGCLNELMRVRDVTMIDMGVPLKVGL